MRHAQQVTKRIAVYASEPYEHGRVVDVVIGQIVGVRIRGDQLVSLLEVNTNDQGIGLRRSVDGHAGEHLAVDL